MALRSTDVLASAVESLALSEVRESGTGSEDEMKYIIDTEFIDTPTCSELISLAIVRGDGVGGYFEFEYPEDQITPWLKENVVPHLGHPSERVTFEFAAEKIRSFIGASTKPEFWAYYGAYDWYWFCRLFGGFMRLPSYWGIIAYHDFAHVKKSIPDVEGAPHHAMNDALSILTAMRKREMI